jgi:hypothetical protein
VASAIVRNHRGKRVKLKSIDEGDVAREHQVVLNQPNDERLPHGHGELVDDAEARGDDEDEVVEENDDEVAKPFDLAVVAEEIEVCDAWKEGGGG